MKKRVATQKGEWFSLKESEERVRRAGLECAGNGPLQGTDWVEKPGLKTV